MALDGKPKAPRESGGKDPVRIVERLLRLLGTIRELPRKALEALDVGTKRGENRFLKLLAVWIGLVFILSTVMAARAGDLMADPTFREIDKAVPEAKWVILAVISVATFVVSGFLADAHVGQTYPRLLITGVQWGLVAIFLVAVAPLCFYIIDILKQWFPA